MSLCMCGDAACPSCGAAMGTLERPCEICGKKIDACQCPECPLCGQVGDINCVDACITKMSTFIGKINELESAAS
jgi:hypothetical protein